MASSTDISAPKRSASGDAKPTKFRRDSKLLLLTLNLISFAMLSVIYCYYISPVWEYAGFVRSDNYFNLLMAVIVLFISAYLVSSRADIRTYFLNLFVISHLIPTLVLMSFGGHRIEYAIVIWVAFLTVIMVSSLPLPRLTIIRANAKNITLVLAISAIAAMSLLVSRGGFRFNLNLSEVYAVREQFDESVSGWLSYILPVITKSVMPFGIVLSLYFRKKMFAAGFLALAVLFFATTGNRGILAYSILSVGVFYFLKYAPKFSVISTGFILFLMVAFLSMIARQYTPPDTISAWDWFLSIGIRRALMVPALLDYYHIDFFSQNPWGLWAKSKLSFGMTESPYDISIPRVIGSAYLHSEETAANTGFIGSGYAQAGIYGVMIYSVGVGFVIAILNAYGRYLGLPIVAAMMTSQVMTMFISTDFITLFLTHGMLVSMFLLAMIRAPQRNTPHALTAHANL